MRLSDKLASWNPRPHFVDPLDHEDSSPHKPIPNLEQMGRNTGRTIGGIGGGLAGLLMPAFAGAATGAAGAYGLEHLLTGHAQLGDTMSQIGAGVGGGLAMPLGLMSAPVGAGIGALNGEQIGGFAGKKLEQLYSPERQAAERIHRLPANQGHALIRTMEQSGNGTPEELQAMRDSYNTRREGFRDQARAGVI